MKERIDILINKIKGFPKEQMDKARKNKKKQMIEKLGLINPNKIDATEYDSFMKKINKKITKKNNEVNDAEYYSFLSKVLLLPATIANVLILGFGGAEYIGLVAFSEVLTSAIAYSNHNNLKNKKKELRMLKKYSSKVESAFSQTNNNRTNSLSTQNDRTSYRKNAVERYGRIILCDGYGITSESTCDNGFQYTKRRR